MKIISLSSSIAGPACAIGVCIKKYFYNNNYKTNIFDYLEISFVSIIQLLNMNYSDIDYLSYNNHFEKNSDGKYTVKFLNFDKIYSHHDLSDNYSESDYKNFIEKYKRRYIRLIDYIKNENKIFFIRYGIEDLEEIKSFISIINKINPKLIFFLIIIVYDDSNNIIKNNNVNCYNLKNVYFYNFYYKLDKNLIYSENLFDRTIQYNWEDIYKIIYDNLDENDIEDNKDNFIYFTK
jgi:hypothetical protein